MAAETRITLEGAPPVEVALRRSARARRISLRVRPEMGEVVLTLPAGVGERQGVEFLYSREAWLRKHLARAGPMPAVPRAGEILHFEGQPRLICHAEGRRIRLEEGTILIPGPEAEYGARLAGFLKVAARNRLFAEVTRYAERLDRRFGRITLRDTRSRWGSCNAKGDLMFSWRLIMAPPPVLDYVAAHEVAHLKRMDHSPAFWTIVERLCPDYQMQRSWLRREGGSLHRLRFEA